MPFKYDADGSLTLYFQNETPGTDREAQLAARAEGSVQSHHAALCAEVGGADGRVESSAG